MTAKLNAPLQAHTNIVGFVISVWMILTFDAITLPRVQARQNKETLDTIGAALDKAGLRGTDAFALSVEQLAKKARQNAIDENRLAKWLRSIYANCLKGSSKCPQIDKPNSDNNRLISLLFDLMGELGTNASVPLLWQLDARRVMGAEDAISHIYTRNMLHAVDQIICKPPATQEINATRETLAGAVVIDVEKTKREARPLTSAEQNDLAYFYASMARPVFAEASSKAEPKTKNAKAAPPVDAHSRAHTYAGFQAAQLSGNLEDIAATAWFYLNQLGFHASVDLLAQPDAASLPADHHLLEILRALASADEALGRFDEAAVVYRAMNPNEGMCETSAGSFERDRIAGLVRAEEQRGNCRNALTARLIAVDAASLNLLGPSRLEKAGFDVARLYRGALLTRNREQGLNAIEDAIQNSRIKDKAQALERLAREGLENWEPEVFAIEGFADTAQQAAVPVLLSLLGNVTINLKTRIVRSLGELASKQKCNACQEHCFNSITYDILEPWQRAIRPLGSDCKSQLQNAMRDKIVNQILPFLKPSGDSFDALNEAAITALGQIGSPLAAKALAQLASTEPCVVVRTNSKRRCVPLDPVRDKAKEAIDNIRAASAKR